VEIVERLNEVLGRASPAAEFGDEDGGIDLARLRERHYLLALSTVVLGTRGGLLEDASDVVAGAPGEGAQVALLALAGLLVGPDPAVDGNLSQLNPLGNRPAEVLRMLTFRATKQCIKQTYI
jgi:hypothetical protein